MTRTGALLDRLERASDWLSPVVVKEVRQVVRGREFLYSFAASLLAGLAIAFFGAVDALTGTGTAGSSTFRTLMGYLALVGLVVVPLGAFNALRLERVDQTLELITLTALSPRRVVVGKLLAQAVKLGTLFAAVAPFIAMSFLLGGIDFVSILVSVAVLFMWSLWTTAACLFVSALAKSRALVGLALGGLAIVMLVVFGAGRVMYLFLAPGAYYAGPMAGGISWWSFAIMTTLCASSLANLLLLAENRLSLPTENRVTALRAGFLVQFLLVVGWALSFMGEPPPASTRAFGAFTTIGTIHIAAVALFTVSEDFTLPRRVLLRMTRAATVRRWLLELFMPGGGRGAMYVLAHMVVLYSAATLFGADEADLSWIVAACGFICFFTGVPIFILRYAFGERLSPLHLRVAVLVAFALSLVLPDLLYYVLWRPDVLDLGFSRRHLINPIRTLANWSRVYSPLGFSLPAGLGVAGLLAYAALVRMGATQTAMAAASASEARQSVVPEEPRNADVIY